MAVESVDVLGAEGGFEDAEVGVELVDDAVAPADLADDPEGVGRVTEHNDHIAFHNLTSSFRSIA